MRKVELIRTTVKTYSAEEIIAGLREKDEKVFRFLFDTYFEPMVHFAEYMLADHAEAENIVQDCFLHLWEKKEFPDIADIKSYLLAQVKNACLNELQRLQLEDKHKKWLVEAYMYAELPNVEYDEELVKKVWRAVDDFHPHGQYLHQTGVQSLAGQVGRIPVAFHDDAGETRPQARKR